MPKRTVLAVDDESEMRLLLRKVLEKEGYAVRLAVDTDQALASIRDALPDLVVLDVRLPRVGGLKLCELLRQDPRSRAVPVVFVTCQSSDVDKVIGLEAGADDYITKPFKNEELAARVKALFRRMDVMREAPTRLESGGVLLDPDAHEASVRGKAVDLWPKEFDLLQVFMEKPGKALSRQFLVERVWGHDHFETSNTLNMTVNRLRKKLGREGRRIEAVTGVGYRFAEPS